MLSEGNLQEATMLPRTQPLVAESNDVEGFDGGVIEFPTRESLCINKGAEESRIKNTEAQRRFRAKLKANKLDLAHKLEEINAHLGVLQHEKRELESNHSRISHILHAQVDHIEQLFSYQAVRDVQQVLLLREMSLLIGRAQGRQVPLDEAMGWTMQQWVSTLFQSYMTRIASLYTEIHSTASPAALEELQCLVAMRHDQEKLGEQFSCMGWALFAWNLEETRKHARPPTQAHWLHVIEGLKLLPHQKEDIVRTRSSMIAKLKAVATDRAAIISRLGIQLLDYQREQIHLCPATHELRASLEKERTAVYTFMVTVCDQTLTPMQEAFLDSHSWPWCADLLQIADLLAAQAQTDDAAPLPASAMDVPGKALAPILPFMSAFQVLASPITAVGTGLRFKRGIVLNPVFTVESSLAFPRPSQAVLQGMPLHAVHAGAFKAMTLWEWHMACKNAGSLVANDLMASWTAADHC